MHTQRYTHTQIGRLKMAMQVRWSERLKLFDQMKKKPQANAPESKFASINKYTHIHTEGVCVHVLVNVAAALVVQIYYKYRLTMDVQHHAEKH